MIKKVPPKSSNINHESGKNLKKDLWFHIIMMSLLIADVIIFTAAASFIIHLT